jgi:hypothetical protein
VANRSGGSRRRAITLAATVSGVALAVWWLVCSAGEHSREAYLYGTLLALWMGYAIASHEWPARVVAPRVEGRPTLRYALWSRILSPIVMPGVFLLGAWAGILQPERRWLAPLFLGVYLIATVELVFGVWARWTWDELGLERRGLISSRTIAWNEVASARAVGPRVLLITTSSGSRFHISLVADGGPEFAAVLLARLPGQVLEQGPGVKTVLSKSASLFLTPGTP